jgi:uncharacterized DUF497 family protein
LTVIAEGKRQEKLSSLFLACIKYSIEWNLNEILTKTNSIRKSTKLILKKLLKSFVIQFIEIADTRFDYGETRYIAIGSNSQMVIISVVYTEREGKIRIISARRANKQEKRLYYDYCK